MVVLITGSSGFLGSAIIERLAANNKIFALDIKEPHIQLPENAAFICTDLTSDDKLNSVMDELQRRGVEEIGSVIHLAAYYNFSGEPSEMYRKLTVEGTGRLLRALKRFKVEQFLFTSTMLVHAPCLPGQKINEDWPVDPKWDYSKSKVATEKLIKERREDIPSVVLRVAGVYDDTCHSIPISHQIQRIYENRLTSHVFPGDISCGQSFIHIDDLAKAIAKIVERRKQFPQETLLLIGEPETYGYKDIQRKLGLLLHGENSWDTQHIPKPIAKTGAWIQDKIPGIEDPFIKPWMIDIADDHYELEIARAEKLLDWTPKKRLIDVLSKMVGALKSDPGKWYQEHGLQQHHVSHA